MLEGKTQAHVFQKENFPIFNNSFSLGKGPQAQSLGLKWHSLLINRQKVFNRNTSPLQTSFLKRPLTGPPDCGGHVHRQDRGHRPP